MIGTGLILAVEPVVIEQSLRANPLTEADLTALLTRHDPAGRARGFLYRGYDHSLAIDNGRAGDAVVDVGSGQAMTGPGAIASGFTVVRSLHRTFLLGAKWLAAICAAAMLTLSILGAAMGWSRFCKSLAGWHRATAWVLLPLIVLAPLTGLLMHYGITFADQPGGQVSRASAPALTLRQAIDVVAAQRRDLAELVSIRLQRGHVTARMIVDGEQRNFEVTAAGMTPVVRNWPRLWHEGNYAGAWSTSINVTTALARLFLLGSGVSMWAARHMRRRARRMSRGAAQPAE